MGLFVEEDECARWHDLRDTLRCAAGQLYTHSVEASLCQTAGGVL